MTEQARTFSRVLGHPIQYVDVPVDHWRQALSQVEGISPYLIEHLGHVAQAHKHGEQDMVTDIVETVGETPPKSLETFIRDNRAAFEPTAP